MSAVSHAPVMAVIMLFEMTLSYDIILPLMMSSVIAYYMAKSLEGASLYSEVLKRKAEAAPEPVLEESSVADMMRGNPPVIAPTAPFARTILGGHRSPTERRSEQPTVEEATEQPMHR